MTDMLVVDIPIALSSCCQILEGGKVIVESVLVLGSISTGEHTEQKADRAGAIQMINLRTVMDRCD
jgi:hypothetical protein